LGRSPKWTIVAAIPHVFTPRKIRCNLSHREVAPGPGVTVAAPPQAHEPENTAGRGAIALEFVGTDTPAAQGHRDGHGAG
jgi:hypothetical protein